MCYSCYFFFSISIFSLPTYQESCVINATQHFLCKIHPTMLRIESNFWPDHTPPSYCVHSSSASSHTGLLFVLLMCQVHFQLSSFTVASPTLKALHSCLSRAISNQPKNIAPHPAILSHVSFFFSFCLLLAVLSLFYRHTHAHLVLEVVSFLKISLFLSTVT